MMVRADKLESALTRADALLSTIGATLNGPLRQPLERWRADAAAARFHLRRTPSDGPLLLAVIGGTGTGKSTLVNRLLGSQVTATSLRRTFTSGAIAIASNATDVPAGWLGLVHVIESNESLPVRGRVGALLVAEAKTPAGIVLIDTPDMDGDQPAHHIEADRAFRWADAVLFLVTPEKYQMTELEPYYRMVRRYEIPSLFAMNKCQEQAVVDDYQKQLSSRPIEARVFAVARDDSGYQVPSDANLDALKARIVELAGERHIAHEGLQHRAADLAGRLKDQIIDPLRYRRQEIARLVGALRSLETAPPGVDVNPVTQQLRQRLQQRSVLYLIGPQRMLDRVRQAPGLMARLPRAVWDYVRTGEIDLALTPDGGDASRQIPDFANVLRDQFAVLQSRIDDLLRSSALADLMRGSTEDQAGATAAPLVAADEAGKIADEELASLRNWLEKRWNATPRDTRILMAMLRYLPGGKKLTQWTEAAPYLLTLIVLTHHAFFGHVDLLVLGGYSLATWVTERLSNEVASQTRGTNQRIADRFARLAHNQIEQTCAWLERCAPSVSQLDQLDRVLSLWEEQ